MKIGVIGGSGLYEMEGIERKRWVTVATPFGKPTDIVVIDQFFDRTKRSKDFTFFGEGIVAHIAFADPICQRVQGTLADCAKRAGATVHVGGTYVNMEGPAFSTRAESHFHRKMG